MQRQWVLASRPRGIPSLENFKLIEKPVPPLIEGQVLIEPRFISVDPYLRGRMRNVKSYVPPLQINEVIDGGVAGIVKESKGKKFMIGDRVVGRLGWQDPIVADESSLQKSELPESSLSQSLGVLGMTGLTAYFALLDLGKPHAGETVLISSAAGAVGSVAGQIAKIKGCRVVGITGSNEKATWLKNDLGFDDVINYKTSVNLRHALKDACPNRIDIYFDNVGGPISDAAMTLINHKARIIICGQMSIYNREETEMGPRNLLYLLVYRARMEGFLVHDYADRFPEGLRDLRQWLKEGKIKHKETIVNGFENTPQAFIDLFNGSNLGKQIVRVR